jgi:hypothetical protein
MGTSDQPSRSKLLLWLAGFVVVFGAVSWLVTGRAGTRVLPLAHNHPPPRASPAFTPGLPTPTPLGCQSREIELTGAFNACTSIDRTSYIVCAVSPHAFNAVFKLLGGSHDFLLYLNIPNRYPEPGDYNLTNGGAEVDLREYATGAFWRSVSGVLATTSTDGRSGSVSAVLEASVGNNSVVPGPTLSVIGPWSCP